MATYVRVNLFVIIHEAVAKKKYSSTVPVRRM